MFEARLSPDRPPSIRAALGLRDPVLMYVGNLEPYQGVDLLLASFARVLARGIAADLVIVGGAGHHIAKYRGLARSLGIAGRVHLVGPRPIEELAHHLAGADVVVSPRLHGHNTPMKVYSYLHSGKPLVATDLPTHTQVIGRDVALLAAPEPEAFAEALVRVLQDPALRAELGRAARDFVEERFTYRLYRQRLNTLLDWLQREACPVP